MAVIDPEIINARRGYADAQAALGGEPYGVGEVRDVSWHDIAVHPEVGYFALAQIGSDAESLVGFRIKVTVGSISVFAYVIGARSVPFELSLSRRAFAHLARLQLASVEALVQVVQ